MTKILSLLIYIFCFSITSVIAQVDDSSKSVFIPAEENEKGTPEESPLNIKPIENNGLIKPNPNKVNGLSVPETNTAFHTDKEFSMFGEKFGNPGELYEGQVKKHLKFAKLEERNQNNGNTTNQYLGDFKTKASTVNIIYRDHQFPDGDRIRIFVDGDVVKSNVLLHQSFSGFKLSLVKGFNKIDFQALNQGTSGPNTAQLQVLDEAGNVIASGTWNLATGVKTTLIVIRE